MAKLPVVSGERLVKALGKGGFEIVRQKGSHVSLRKGKFKTVVPLHSKLAKGTLKSILRQCGLSTEELMGLLK
jgi:predicted RNA binding protein YcfA (HicA-like mRNA interferase family)